MHLWCWLDVSTRGVSVHSWYWWVQSPEQALLHKPPCAVLQHSGLVLLRRLPCRLDHSAQLSHITHDYYNNVNIHDANYLCLFLIFFFYSLCKRLWMHLHLKAFGWLADFYQEHLFMKSKKCVPQDGRVMVTAARMSMNVPQTMEAAPLPLRCLVSTPWAPSTADSVLQV